MINIIQGHYPPVGESQLPMKYHYWRIFALHKAIICEVNISIWVASLGNIWNRKQPTWLLTHWDRATHICVGKLTIIGSDNGLSPGRRQAIINTNAGILLIGPLGTNFSEILSEIHSFSFKKMHLKMSSGKWRPSCLGLNVLMYRVQCRTIVMQLHEIKSSPCSTLSVYEYALFPEGLISGDKSNI